MKELERRFQDDVDRYLIRHRSILDVLSKINESAARVNRAVSKSVTSCGCITIDATKQQIPPDASLSELRDFMATHVQGQLCERCREIVETEIGSTLFYLAAACEVLGLDMESIVRKERQRISALGVYRLT
ncbi:MAG: DUF1573 domain-containing protein [Armatimonadetes bacterium]|nr:DUF1573 domain-containing protein [Armatimonadota bacterium]